MSQLVVARVNESLDWMQHLPTSWQVTVYNAGAPLQAGDFDRKVAVHACPAGLPASAVVADSFLRHLQKPLAAGAADDLTVFCPGNPLAHAPDFLALLDQHERFAALQPLSIGHGLAADLAQADGRDWIDALPVRTERYALATLTPLACSNDAALRAGRAYRRKHGLAEGENLMAHFLSLAGLEDSAALARHADLGVLAHGPVFAVRRSLLATVAQRLAPRIETLRLLARADQNYPEVFQHAWLHLFGLPFISLTGLALPQDTRAQQPARAAAPAMTRVVASIDAVLARAEPATRIGLRTIGEPVAPPTLTAELSADSRPIRATPSVADLRVQAQRAEAQGDLHTAWAHLDKGLRMAPRHIDLLADATALAYRQNDTERATHCARRALAVEPDHLDCLFTLGMCLAAQGQAEEAVTVLARLDSLPQARDWQADNPDLVSAVSSLMGSLPGVVRVGGPALSAGHRVAAA